VASPSASYEPRSPAASLLYRVVQEHVETFRAQAASLREGEGLPRFVEAEFRDFLRCGFLAGGFARFRCAACGLDRLVAVFVRAVVGGLHARARDGGVGAGRGGAVAVIQRFGGALNPNVHIHALVLDGVFTRRGAEAPTLGGGTRLAGARVDNYTIHV
jgi:hypothetical protein